VRQVDVIHSGRRLGRYEVGRLIGSGGFGAVYLARHVDLGVWRALKVLHEGMAGDAAIRTRFLREARIAARLCHPNIVSVLEYGIEQDAQYLVMDYVDGVTLGSLMSGMEPRRRLVDRTIRQAVGDIAAALDHAHAEGVAHRDLKPSNVLVRRVDGRALLTDFGLARSGFDADLTRTERSLGTFAYMSPEQCLPHRTVTTSSDIYSFAALLFEVACGRPPYGHGLAAIAGHLADGTPVASVRDADPGLPPALDEAVARGLAREPEDRVASAGALASAFLTAATPSAREPADRSRRGPANARRRPALALLVAAAFAITGVVATSGAAALHGVGRAWPSPAPPPPSPSAASTTSPTQNPAARRSWPRYGYDLTRTSQVVSAIQLLLIWHGLSVGPTGADGSFGSSTEGAVLEFQRDNGLTATGTANEETWERLVVALGPNDRGPHVEAAQRLLRAWNARLGPPINGVYGTPTEAALEAFQKAKGLPRSDRLDVDAWCVLVGGRVARPSPATTAH
jgi:serine/threonine protein kinase